MLHEEGLQPTQQPQATAQQQPQPQHQQQTHPPASTDPTSGAYWEATNIAKGEFQWAAISAADLARVVADFLGRSQRSLDNTLHVMVAGAGTSRDAAELASALRGSDVFAPDFSPAAVAFQRSLGVASSLEDLLIVKDAWRGRFDVIVDDSFTDVFTSDWNAGDTPRKLSRCTPAAKSALRNILAYLRPGGLLVVKSIIASEEEFAQYVRAATRREYAPDVCLAADMLRDLGNAPTTRSRYGRVVPTRLAISGHVGLWVVP